jgi:hypothetical protein
MGLRNPINLFPVRPCEQKMRDVPRDIVALLRADFATEVEAGFPRLRRIPQTKVIQFLDYFANLGPEDQSALLDALALRGSVVIRPSSAVNYPSAPAFDRYWQAVTSPGPFTGGYRYCDIKSLAAIPKIPEFGSYETWIEKCQRPGVSEKALQPREDLLPNMNCLAPAKASALRKLVRAALQGRGFAADPVIDPRLGPLQNNGGHTETLALFADSPAIGHGDNNAVDPVTRKPITTDQRGHKRIDQVGEVIDIGAYECP